MSDPVELRTERLFLRPFKLDDVGEVFAYASDPEWARCYGFEHGRMSENQECDLPYPLCEVQRLFTHIRRRGVRRGLGDGI